MGSGGGPGLGGAYAGVGNGIDNGVMNSNRTVKKEKRRGSQTQGIYDI